MESVTGFMDCGEDEVVVVIVVVVVVGFNGEARHRKLARLIWNM